jgi:hypothetical protein
VSFTVFPEGSGVFRQVKPAKGDVRRLHAWADFSEQWILWPGKILWHCKP